MAMIWLSNSSVSRLRDRLRAHGQPSAPLQAADEATKTPAGADLEALEMRDVAAQYEPFCEAMYLMMSADGKITRDEREVLKGALRSLSAGSVGAVQIEALVDRAAKQVAEHGRDARLRDVIARLREDPVRSEVAFVLAAAIAFADNAIADEENEVLVAFAEGLGIDEERADELLDSVEADLGDRPA
jgi:tellurite resistance protein